LSEKNGIRSLSPLSTRPFRIESSEELPYLSKEIAAVAIGIGGVAAFGAILQMLLTMDPWAAMYWNEQRRDFYDVSIIFLIVLSVLIAVKQLRYYYDTKGPHRKHGIFVKVIRQVNPREEFLDYVIAVTGGVLIVVSVTLPVFWFLMVSIFSFHVVLRCYVTLRRKVYSRRLQDRGVEVPQWYVEALDKEHNGMVVKSVLAGWVISQTLTGAYSLIVFVCFYLNFSLMSGIHRILFLATSLLGLFLLYYCLSGPSYRWGKTLAVWMNV